MSSVRFGPFIFDEQRNLLFERGTPVSLGRRVLALLGTLLAARGDVVSKGALMEAAWPSLYVEESNLTVQIAALRKRLSGSSRNEDWIATFPRVGYRFAGPFTVEEGEPAAAPRRTGERRRVDLAAFAWYVRGRSLMLQSPGGNRLARSYLLKALEREPAFAPAHGCLGITYFGEAIYFGRDIDANRAAGLAHARTAVALDPDDATARWALGFVRLYSGQIDEAQAEWEKALRAAPDQPDILAKLGDLTVQEGEPLRGVALVQRAIALDPCAPGCTYWDLGFAHYAAGQYAEAVEVLRRAELDRLPGKRILAASLAQLGRLDEARAEAQRFLVDNPDFRIGEWAATQAFRHKDDLAHFVDGYTRAGLPQ